MIPARLVLSLSVCVLFADGLTAFTNDCRVMECRHRESRQRIAELNASHRVAVCKSISNEFERARKEREMFARANRMADDPRVKQWLERRRQDDERQLGLAIERMAHLPDDDHFRMNAHHMECNLIFARREREDDHRRLREFERLIAEERCRPRSRDIRKSAPLRVSRRGGRGALPSSSAIQEEMRKEGWRSGIPPVYRNTKVIMGSITVILLAFLLSVLRKVREVREFLERNKDFRWRYEGGVVNRPVGRGVCWYCGDKAMEIHTGEDEVVSIGMCGKCYNFVKGLVGWVYAMSFLSAAGTFIVVCYHSYWFFDEGEMPAWIVAGVAALIIFLATRYVLTALRNRLLRHFLVCRDEVERE